MTVRDVLLRLKAILGRGRMENELDEELRAHLELQTQKHLAAGFSVEEARVRARREFGAVELAKENCRDARRVNGIETFIQDLRYALRGIRREPVLTLVAFFTLAICIAANTTVFSIVNSVMLRPLPYPAAERLYWLGERMGRNQAETAIGADYYSFREENHVFEDVAAYSPHTLNLTGVERPEQLDAAQVSPSFFKVLATQPLMGRYLAESEQGVKAPDVIIVSYRFWRSHMASDPRALGKTISLDGIPRTVIGIMPQGFDFPKGTQLWTPLPMDEATQRPRRVDRPMRIVSMLARLKQGVTEQQLTTELDRLSHSIYREYPKEFASSGFLTGLTVVAVPLQRQMVGDLRPSLLVLSGAVALVLLIACANLANLLLARAAARQREIGSANGARFGTSQNR